MYLPSCLESPINRLMNTDYRDYLKGALAEQFSQRPGYSLRAFARQAGISASHLSRVLNGKKDLSHDSARRIAMELNMPDHVQEHFLDLVSWHSADSHTKKLLTERLSNREQNSPYRTLEMDMFKVLADWYCLPLLELTQTKEFKSDIPWIAKRLKISNLEVQTTIDRLISLQLLERDASGNLRTTNGTDVQTPNDIASVAIRKHHEQMTRKAAEALNEQDVEEREFQGMHLSFDPQNIRSAKKVIRDFIAKFEAEFKTVPGAEVYQLNMQFFRLTQKSQEGD